MKIKGLFLRNLQNIGMNNLLIERLTTSIRQNIPQGMNPANFLMETLAMSKEAVYRRLRGDVPFTFEDVIKISQRLGTSIDEIANESNAIEKSKWAVLNPDMLYSNNSSKFNDQYIANGNKILGIFSEMQQSKKAMARSASTSVPYSFMMLYEKLTLFWHYKRAYLMHGVRPDFVFSKMIIPGDILKMGKELVAELRKISRSLFILDKNIFGSLVNDIEYFYHKNLILKEELLALKEELLDLLVLMEALTISGEYSSGSEVNIYLSEVTLDSSYLHLESDFREFSFNWIYFIDILTFSNSKIGEKQKEWIDLLKRYSILITQTGETERFEFFNNQRSLINGLI